MTNRFVRSLRRTDGRAAIVIATTVLTVSVLQSWFLYRYVAVEALEQADAWVDHSLHTIHREVSNQIDPTEALAEFGRSLDDGQAAARVTTRSGAVSTWGAWPKPEQTQPAVTGEDTRSLFDADLLKPGILLYASTSLADGGLLEAVVSLDPFAEEAFEVRDALMFFTVLLSASGLFAAISATFWAFKPLRDATDSLNHVGPHDLSNRLVDRGTLDPIDRHARELNQKLEDIEASFARIRAFGNEIAHEFRTPLNRIAMVADVASGGTEEEARAALSSIRATAGDLSRLVDSLLMISEVENHGATIAHQPIDVAERLSKVVALYEPAFSDRDSPLRIELSPANITGVPELFDRVIINLLENVLQHTPARTEIEVDCRIDWGRVLITVDDSGDGVPGSTPDEMNSIFDRFARGPGEHGQGHGLGLALSRTIARFHGGDLTVDTSRLGGARFVWWSPLRNDPPYTR